MIAVMASEGSWKLLPRVHRRYLAALGAPESITVLAHDMDHRDYAEIGVRDRSAEAYRLIVEAAVSCGLDEFGTPVVVRRREGPRFEWSHEAVLSLPTRAPKSIGFGRAAAHVVAIRDDPHSTFVFVASDWDGYFPKHVLAWGPRTGTAVVAVESALAHYRQRHPVIGESI